MIIDKPAALKGLFHSVDSLIVVELNQNRIRGALGACTRFEREV